MNTNKLKYFLFLSVLTGALSGCLGTKHLDKNEKLLYRQDVQAPKGVDREALRGLYVQKPNRKILGTPIAPLVGVHYFGKRFYDSTDLALKKERIERKFDRKIAATNKERRIQNLQFRKQKQTAQYDDRILNGNIVMQWGEPVSVFDSAAVNLTEIRFKDYLYARGYFNSRITSRLTQIGKLVYVRYRVEPGEFYTIDTILYRIQDSTIYQLVQASQTDSYIKANTRYDATNFSREHERLDLLLKDHGFYDFSRQYISFGIDSTYIKKPGKHMAVMVIIRDPAKRGYHKQFKIDSVSFTTDATQTIIGMQRQQREFRRINYHYYVDNYSLKILSQRVFILPGDDYSRTNTFNTQRQLANLDAFKFVNINYDTSGGKFIANIFASPLDRYEWSNEVGVNVTQGFPGPFYNINFRKRNIFRGLENFDLNGRIGFEGVASATSEQNIYRSTEASANASITFPQFLWPLRERAQLRLARYNPKTRLSIGYAFTDRPEYRRTSTNISNTYTWDYRRITQYSLTTTNVSLISSKTAAEFDEILQRQNDLGNFNLVNSFLPSFVSSMIFGITWNPDSYGTYDRNSVFVRAQFESGGTSLNFINPDIITRQGLQYFQYLRANLDVRRNRILSKWASLAYRLNSGVAYSYSPNQTLPYEKFFFAGGSNSVRAWRPRRLGLGSQPPRLSDNPRNDGLYNYRFERPGEILLEGSIELRGNLIGFLDGAVFVDAGNVWSFRSLSPIEEISDSGYQGNTRFKADSFYKEVGVGTGFGLRLDFTFLILRFDVGIKVYDPAREPGDRFVLDKMRFLRPFGTNREPVIYNIGVGYPF